MNRNSLLQKLRDKLDQDYFVFLEELSGLTLQEYLSRSEEITVHENLYHQLSSGKIWKDEHLLYLSQFPRPLETLCRWFQYERRDWDETLRHILWNIYDKRGSENTAQEEQEDL